MIPVSTICACEADTINRTNRAANTSDSFRFTRIRNELNETDILASKGAINVDRTEKWPTTGCRGPLQSVLLHAMPLNGNDALVHDARRIRCGGLGWTTTMLWRFGYQFIHVRGRIPFHKTLFDIAVMVVAGAMAVRSEVDVDRK